MPKAKNEPPKPPKRAASPYPQLPPNERAREAVRDVSQPQRPGSGVVYTYTPLAHLFSALPLPPLQGGERAVVHRKGKPGMYMYILPI